VVDEKVKNQIIQAWSKTEVILDPAELTPDLLLKGKGALKKLPDNVSYDKTERQFLDVHALESSAALGARFVTDP
jgi:hypothetical protein